MPLPKPSKPFLEGLRACLPVVPGVLTFGVICGVGMTSAGLPAWVAILMSGVVFAGTAQLAALQLAGAGTPLAVILAAAVIINLRFMLYSLSMAPYLRQAPGRVRAWAAYLLSDNGYAHFIARHAGHAGDVGAVPYFLGACFAVWAAWQVGTVAGAVVGSRIPSAWSLEFTVTLTFVALAVSTIKDRAIACAAIASAVVATLAVALPFRMGLILAAAAGIAAGVAAERWTR